MTTAIQRRRGSTAEHSTFTGLLGELTVDTTKKTVVVHDGITAGGIPLAKAGANTDITSISGTSIPASKTLLVTEDIGVTVQPYGAPPKNTIINGNFQVNQEPYTSGSAVGTDLYGHDMWKMAESADTYTYSTVDNKTTVTIPAGKVLRQVVEGLNLQTGTYTLSWEGTAQGKIGAGAYGVSGITGTAVGGTNLTIEFGPGTVSRVQFEAGSIATPFENRLIGAELMLCQRHYQKLISAVLVQGDTTAAYGAIPLTCEMRATPTISGSSTSYTIYGGGTVSNLSAPSIQTSRTTQVHIGVTFAAAGAIGRPGLYICNLIASARL